MRKTETADQKLLGNAGILLTMNLAASALNYAYQILLARFLGVDAFGTVYSIFSLLLVLAVPGATFTMLASQRLATLTAQNNRYAVYLYVRDMTKKVTWFSLGVFLVGLVCRHPLALFLKRQDAALLLCVILACALGYYHPLYTGCMSGAGRFALAGAYGLMIPAYKFLGLAGIAFAGGDDQKMLGVLLAVILGSVFTACFGYRCFCARAPAGQKEGASHERSDPRFWGMSFLINICLAVYVNIDVFAVRWVGGETVSGLYSAVSLFGKMIYYCAAALGTVLLPTVAVADEANSRRLLKKAVAVTAALSVAGLLFLNVLKVPMIQLLYGESYRPAAEYMGCMSLISFSVGLLTLLANYFVGISRVKHLKNALLILAVFVAVICFVVGDVRTVLLMIGAAGLICVGYLLLSVWQAGGKHPCSGDNEERV